MSSLYPQDWNQAETYRWLLRELPQVSLPPQLRYAQGAELLALTRADLDGLHLSEALIENVLSKVEQLKQDADNASMLVALQLQTDCIMEKDSDSGMSGVVEALDGEFKRLQASLHDRAYAEMLDRFSVNQTCQELSDFEIARRY
jgi:hypothetical protein